MIHAGESRAHVGLDVPRVGADHARCGAGCGRQGWLSFVSRCAGAHVHKHLAKGQAAAVVWLVHVVWDPLHPARGLGHVWGLGGAEPHPR